MRSATLALVLGVLAATPAAAQSAITINANPVPIVAAQINGRPARIEVDIGLPSMLLLNQSAAERLDVRPNLIGRLSVSTDGATSLRGRAMRARIMFDGREARVDRAGIFAAPVSAHADGVIGPHVLPHDRVTVVLRAPAAGEREIVLPLVSNRTWLARTEVGGHPALFEVSLVNEETMFSRSLSRSLDADGAIVSEGALVPRTVTLGLIARMQPVRTELSVFGLPLSPALARTDAPLMGVEGADTVVVESTAPPPPIVVLGRAALSRCSSITADRPARTLTLRCAA